METYTCEECGLEFTEDELDRDSFNSGDGSVAKFKNQIQGL